MVARDRRLLRFGGRRMVAFASATLVIGVLLMAPAATFSATSPTKASSPVRQSSAYGCTVWGEPVTGLPADYCVYLSGSGLSVGYVTGGFATTTQQVCAWNITAEFFDTSWRWYKTYKSPSHSGCTRRGSDRINIGANMRAGYMCSTLKPYGTVKLASVCHRVHA